MKNTNKQTMGSTWRHRPIRCIHLSDGSVCILLKWLLTKDVSTLVELNGAVDLLGIQVGQYQHTINPNNNMGTRIMPTT
jgi:hypothetical protein